MNAKQDCSSFFSVNLWLLKHICFYILQGNNVITNMTKSVWHLQYKHMFVIWFSPCISRIHLLHIHVILLSSFLLSLVTCLQVAFKCAMLYVDDIVWSVFLIQFSCWYLQMYRSSYCLAFVHPLLCSVSFILSAIYYAQA